MLLFLKKVKKQKKKQTDFKSSLQGIHIQSWKCHFRVNTQKVEPTVNRLNKTDFKLWENFVFINLYLNMLEAREAGRLLPTIPSRTQLSADSYIQRVL